MASITDQLEWRDQIAMTSLRENIAAFDAVKAYLEADHLGEWVVFEGGTFIKAFKSFEEAAAEAVDRFENSAYLIRQVGAPPVQLPGGMVFRPTHVNGPGWL